VQPLLQWKTISITYAECVSVAMSVQHAMQMHHIVPSDMSGSTIFFHIISYTVNGKIFGEKKSYRIQNVF